MRRRVALALLAALWLTACGAPPPVARPARPATPTATAHAAGGAAHAPARGGATASADAAVPAKARLPVPQAVPILMYHVIAKPSPLAPYHGLYVDPDVFARQMRALAAAGYHTVTESQLYDAWYRRGTLPPHPVVISFDDGYRSVYTAALPVMKGLGYRGEVDLQLGMLGRPGGLTPAEVRGLIAAGWEIDSHTILHTDLTRDGPALLHSEVFNARAELQHEFGVPADFFCYPSGRFNARVVAAVRAAGYLGATTTEPGLATPADPYTWKRVRVPRGLSATGLVRELASLVPQPRAASRARPAGPPRSGRGPTGPRRVAAAH